MSKLNRMPWQIHVMKDPNEIDKLKIVTNTFMLSGLTHEELRYATFPFIGCPGKLEIRVHDCVGTEAQRKGLFENIVAIINGHKRAAGFLTPLHSALHTYWYNVASEREKYDVRGLKDILKGKPLLYCGAGPSLEKNIGTIKTIIQQGKAFVVTGGTGIKILHDSGVVPHLCLAIDPFMQEWDRFKDLDEQWQKDSLLLASNSLNPLCYEAWKGDLIAAEGMNCMPVGEYIEDDPVKLEEGPVGVTTWLMEVAQYMGAKTIYTIGTDLCFGPSGETYSGDMDMPASQYSFIADHKGRATKSNWVFEADFIGKAIKDKGYTVVNCSNGLKIPGARAGKLEELLEIDTEEIFLPMIPCTRYKTDLIRERMKRFAKELRDIERNLADPGLQSLDGYVFLLKQYDDVQEYQYWRTGMFNYSLIREVCLANANLIEGILDGTSKYRGETLYGHLGSPNVEDGVDKIRTGSKYYKENNNERFNNSSSTSQDEQ